MRETKTERLDAEIVNLKGQIKLLTENPDLISDFYNIINRLERENFAQSDLIAKLEAAQEKGKAVVSAEQIVDCLLAEYEYWKEADCEASIGAMGALSNVIAFATIRDHRADWHPEKENS